MADDTTCGGCGARVLGTDRFCRSCGAVLAGADSEADARKTVVVLFIDLVGSTTLAERLDPEVLRGVLDRYYKVCSECIAEHLGVVEKYIGDAVMAAFGVPVSREDDAVRAVRAAYKITELVRRLGAGLGLPGVTLDVHCGISAGEAAVITATGAHLRVIGDTVNTAARLQSAAGPGEVLVNEEVAEVVRPLVELAAVPPLRLKGKADPVPAWRVLSLHAPARLHDRTPLVGRRAERDALISAYRRVVAARECRQVTVLGAAGLGKSRLVREFTGAAETRDALVLTGRCESYGRDITYQPLASMLMESLPGGWARVRELFGGADAAAEDRRALSCLSSVVAREQEPYLPVGVEEIASAVRRLFGTLARQRPLVVVWEDLHWAEPTLLGLIDGLAAWLRDVPVLLVCVARELPSGGTRIALEPLDDGETRELVTELVAAGDVQGQAQVAAAEHIAVVCEGNPLFATMMADTLADDRGHEGLPPTVSAVLRARVDALPRDERLVLQWAAVCGREFRAGWLRMIAGDAGDEAGLRAALGGLLRAGVLQQVDVDRYRFVQNLLHDTGYAMTAKSSRARWHVALADGLSSVPEAVMYHAEAACLLLREISPGDDALARLAGTAVRLLEAQGTIALHRKDLGAATALLERARALLRPGAPRYAGVVLRLTDALVASGDGERALAVLTAPELSELSELSDLGRAERLTVELQLYTVRLRLGLLAEPEGRAFAGEVSVRLAGFPGDDLNWCLRHQFVALLELAAGRTGVAETELRNALDRARILDDRYSQDRLLGALCELGQWSPTPAAEVLRLCAELEERFAADRLLLVPVLVTKARLLALTGDGGAARAAVQQARRHAADLHARLAELAVGQVDALVAGLLGEHVTARRLFSTAAAELRELGHPVSALTLEVYAVRETLRSGDFTSAAQNLELLGSDGLEPGARVWLDLLRARLAGLNGDPAGGVAIARRVLDTVGSEDPCLLGDAWFEYAEVLRLDGRLPMAAAAAERAVGYYRAKGATLPVEAVRSWADGALR